MNCKKCNYLQGDGLEGFSCGLNHTVTIGIAKTKNLPVTPKDCPLKTGNVKKFILISEENGIVEMEICGYSSFEALGCLRLMEQKQSIQILKNELNNVNN